MNQLIRILNESDRAAVAWLCTHVGDARVAAAARHLGRTGMPYVSAVCRYLGVRPPVLGQYTLPAGDYSVGDRHLAEMRRFLLNRNSNLTRSTKPSSLSS